MSRLSLYPVSVPLGSHSVTMHMYGIEILNCCPARAFSAMLLDSRYLACRQPTRHASLGKVIHCSWLNDLVCTFAFWSSQLWWYRADSCFHAWLGQSEQLALPHLSGVTLTSNPEVFHERHLCQLHQNTFSFKERVPFFWVHGEWIVARDKLFRAMIHFPWTQKKRHSFLIFIMLPTKTLSKILWEKL